MARRRQGASRTDSSPQPAVEFRHAVPLLGFLGGAALLYGVMVKVTDPAVLPVNAIRIESPLVHVKPEQLREVVAQQVTPGFLQVDVEQIRTDLEAMPWVRRASVRRGWPDRLLVQVEEQQPLARWSGGGLVNAEGELFKPHSGEDWQALPLLRGPEGTEQTMAKALHEMQGILTPLGLAVSHLTMNERRSWDLRLENGLRLGLGKSDAKVRLLRFVRVYAEVLMPRLDAIDSVDLRYTNGFAVRWRDGHAPAAV